MWVCVERGEGVEGVSGGAVMCSGGIRMESAEAWSHVSPPPARALALARLPSTDLLRMGRRRFRSLRRCTSQCKFRS